jgi:hypothetical protein
VGVAKSHKFVNFFPCLPKEVRDKTWERGAGFRVLRLQANPVHLKGAPMMYFLDTCVVGMQSSSFRDPWLFGCVMKLGSRKMILEQG